MLGLLFECRGRLGTRRDVGEVQSEPRAAQVKAHTGLRSPRHVERMPAHALQGSSAFSSEVQRPRRIIFVVTEIVDVELAGLER